MNRLVSLHLLLLSAMALSSSCAFGQPLALSYRPVAAEFSRAIDRLITVSGNPNTLHV
jgi:hypothetical protein